MQFVMDARTPDDVDARRAQETRISAAPQVALQPYIERARGIPPLSREQEYALACRIRDQGDDEAARRLVEANLRHVVAIAWNYRRYGVRMADLVSEGNVGLMVALKKFDPDRGTRFVTYASHWIRAYVLDHVIRTWSVVGIGSGPLRSKVFFRLRREKAKIMASTGDGIEVTEKLAEQFGTTPEKLASMAQRLELRDASLDAKVFSDGTATILDTLACGLPSQEEQFLRRERSTSIDEWVREAMSRLDPRERFVVEVRIMAESPDELSLAEVGRRLGISRERARQIESRAKAKIRRYLQAYKGRLEALAA